MKLNFGSVVVAVLLILWNFGLLARAMEEEPEERLGDEEHRETTRCETPYTDDDWTTLTATAGRLLSPWPSDLRSDIILTCNVEQLEESNDTFSRLEYVFSTEYLIARLQTSLSRVNEARPRVNVEFGHDNENSGLTVEFVTPGDKLINATLNLLKEGNSSTPVLVELNGNTFRGGVVLDDGDFVIMSTANNSTLALPPQNLLDFVKSQGVSMVYWMSGVRHAIGSEGIENLYIARLRGGSFCNIYNNMTLLPANNVGCVRFV